MIGNNRLAGFLPSAERTRRNEPGPAAADRPRGSRCGSWESVNWFVSRHPLAFLATALAAGVVVACWIKRR